VGLATVRVVAAVVLEATLPERVVVGLAGPLRDALVERRLRRWRELEPHRRVFELLVARVVAGVALRALRAPEVVVALQARAIALTHLFVRG
jgi:hypothetical protein